MISSTVPFRPAAATCADGDAAMHDIRSIGVAMYVLPAVIVTGVVPGANAIDP